MAQPGRTHYYRSISTIVILGICIITALAIRLPFFNFVTGDYLNYTQYWYHFVQVHGVNALRYNFSNYTPPYQYLLLLTETLLPALKSLYAIKVISVVFDFACAVAAYLVIRACSSDRRLAWIGFFIVLVCPTVVANSAIWGQADAIYTTFLLLAIWRLTKRDPLGGLAFYCISFAIKLQAIFLLPLFIYITLEGELSLRDWLILPVVFLLSTLPAVTAGRPPLEALTVYFGQLNSYEELTLLAPSVYQWLPRQPQLLLGALGVAAAGLFVVILWFLLRRSGKPILEQSVFAAMALQLTIPFLLPRMHDRYFFPADVLSLIIACLDRRLRWLPFLVVGASSMAYVNYLNGIEILPLGIAAMFMFMASAGVLIIVCKDASRTNNQSLPQKIPPELVLWRNGFPSHLALLATIGFYVIAITVGTVRRTRIDQQSIAARLSLDSGSVVARSLQAIRCNDLIRLNVTWTDMSGMDLNKPVSVFVHLLDRNQNQLVQADGYVDGRIALNTLVWSIAEQRDIPVDNPGLVSDLQVGAYQVEGQRRFLARKADGAEWPEDAITVPVQDGICN